MSQAFDNLKSAVAAQNSIKASIETFIQGVNGHVKQLEADNADLRKKLDAKEAGEDHDAEAQSFADQLNAGAAEIADLVVQNTPVATVGGTASDTDTEGKHIDPAPAPTPETSNDGTSAKTESADSSAAPMDPSKEPPAADLNTAVPNPSAEAEPGVAGMQDNTITGPAEHGSFEGLPRG